MSVIDVFAQGPLIRRVREIVQRVLQRIRERRQSLLGF